MSSQTQDCPKHGDRDRLLLTLLRKLHNSSLKQRLYEGWAASKEIQLSPFTKFLNQLRSHRPAFGPDQHQMAKKGHLASPLLPSTAGDSPAKGSTCSVNSPGTRTHCHLLSLHGSEGQTLSTLTLGVGLGTFHSPSLCHHVSTGLQEDICAALRADGGSLHQSRESTGSGNVLHQAPSLPVRSAMRSTCEVGTSLPVAFQSSYCHCQPWSLMQSSHQ